MTSPDAPPTFAPDIEAAIHEWDGVLGTSTPVVIQIVSGLRTRLASTNRVV